MGTMPSDAAAYSYLIFCCSVLALGDGSHRARKQRVGCSYYVVWGINLAYPLSALFYQLARFDQHPRGSLTTVITSVILINALLTCCDASASGRG